MSKIVFRVDYRIIGPKHPTDDPEKAKFNPPRSSQQDGCTMVCENADAILPCLQKHVSVPEGHTLEVVGYREVYRDVLVADDLPIEAEG